MNVVNREQGGGRRPELKRKNIGLIVNKKNTGMGILGPSSRLTVNYALAGGPRPAPKAPRYQFGNEPSTSKSKKSSMGPPTGPVRPLKKRSVLQSGSGRTEWSSGGPARPRVLASDSLAESSLHTPANRPTALRYISSSSKGRTLPHSSRSTATSVVEPTVILAITEGRGSARGEVGLAAVDVRRPHLVLCQFSDSLLYTHTLTKVNYFNPVEIIVPHTFCENAPTPLYQLLRDRCRGVTLSTVQRRHFNSALGLQQVQALCAPAYSAVYMQLLHKFYALTAAAAVLTYVEYIQCVVFAQGSLKVEYHSSENTMVIDVDTASQLELVTPLEPSAGPTCCLLGVLGPTLTAGGVRALRAAILQPSSCRVRVEERLDCVRELVEDDEGLVSGVQDVLKKLCEVEKILVLCLESPKQESNRLGEQMNQVLLLKTTMELVPPLVQALEPAQSGRLRMIKIDLENPDYIEIADRIRSVIQDDARVEKGSLGNLQRCFAVKPEINGLLDVARRTYSELIDDIQKIVEGLSEAYDLPMRLNQNALKGFHIVMPLARNRRSFNVEDLPSIFIQVQNTGASVTMTTEELVVLDQQAKESLNEIHSMSNIVVYGLLKELRPFMGSLYKLCEDIAELDILLALAQASSVNSYVRPQFNEYVEIRNSVHPLLDYNSQTMPVANDIFASPEYNFTIVTGPNMGGKSIYIKQVAVLHVMAQVGCFVPATSAVLRMTDHIFSRIGFNDSVELNASTFVLEMKEIQHILLDLTPTSLVIIDELCRGTSSEEGASVAWAVCEELLQRPAFTFFTTHFLYLTRLQHLYRNVTNLHTDVSEEVKPDSEERSLIYQHKVVPGVTKVEQYGLALAKNTNLPETTIKLAEELAEVIKLTKKPQRQETSEQSDEILLYKLNADIKREMRKSSDHQATRKNILIAFRKKHPDLMQRLKAMDESKTETSATSAPASSKSSNTPVNVKNDPNKPVNPHTSSSGEGATVKHEDKVGETMEFKENFNEGVVNDEVQINDQQKSRKINIISNVIVNADNFPVKNTTQLLKTIPQEQRSCNTGMMSNTIDINENLDSSEGSNFELEEDSSQAVDVMDSDNNFINPVIISKSDDEFSENVIDDNFMEISPTISDYDNSDFVDIANCSTQILDLNLSSDNGNRLSQKECRLFASQSTLVLDKQSQCLSKNSSSPVSSTDEQLYVETVAEIHNEMCFTSQDAIIPDEALNVDLNDLAEETTDNYFDILLPPPIQFAD